MAEVSVPANKATSAQPWVNTEVRAMHDGLCSAGGWNRGPQSKYQPFHLFSQNIETSENILTNQMTEFTSTTQPVYHIWPSCCPFPFLFFLASAFRLLPHISYQSAILNLAGFSVDSGLNQDTFDLKIQLTKLHSQQQQHSSLL